ncbi:MAG TPA: thioredoxin family protein [Thermoanaerobaculia bacterium]|jgi:thiol:disulfide interchange protein
MKRRLALSAALLLLLAAGDVRAGAGRREPAPYDPSRDPTRDLADAMREARRDGKRVLLEVGGNWCGWCREFERFVRADSAVAESLRCAFVVVRVNVSPENENARFLSAYPQVPGYPYVFVLDEAGSLLASVDTDDFLNGESYDRARLMAFVRKWSRPDSKAAGG